VVFLYLGVGGKVSADTEFGKYSGNVGVGNSGGMNESLC
jgi:hypothetical protein